MTEQSNQSQNPPAGDEHPEVFSISQDKDGSFHFSRRDFLYASVAIGGTLLLRGVCPRFGAGSAPSGPLEGGIAPLTGVYIHAAPSIASDIMDTLQQNDFVRLISDHPDLGWVQVATRSGQQGWVKRSFVDFSRAIRSSSPNFDLSSTLTPTPTQTHPTLTSTPTPAQTHPSRAFSVQLFGGDNSQRKASTDGQAQACGDAIQNGNFEAGPVSWSEESPGYIIRNDWSDPYQGSWVAWFGGLDAVERLTQLFHVPANVQDVQKLEFYLKVTSEESTDQSNDTFCLRFLDAGGTPVSSDILIADNTTQGGWWYIYIDLTGMTGFADQDIQIQFEAVVDASLNTYFVIDSVSFDLICEDAPTYYVYLPVIVREPTPTPTSTPTSTPTPTATPCPGDCTYDCPSYCYSDCLYDCPSDCYSDCPSDCIYYCPFDCIYDCSWDCSYDCSYDYCYYYY